MSALGDTRATLTNGVEIPLIGAGFWRVRDEAEAARGVRSALDLGYRSIDTAAIYGNEVSVGRGLRESRLERSEVFVTSKLWTTDQGHQSALDACDESLRKLGLDYLDLYLIHWPVAELLADTWRAFERLYETGKVRAIGVSNFYPHHLAALTEHAQVAPMVDQVEFHPWMTQAKLRAYSADSGIQLEAWSPLGHGELLADPVLAEIGARYGASPAQVILRWDIEHGVVTIPKATNPAHLEQNAAIFDFTLTAEDIGRIDALNRDRITGPYPDDFEFEF